MALIPCPECKQSVSSRATACPHCGLALTGEPAGAGAGTGASGPGDAAGRAAASAIARPPTPGQLVGSGAPPVEQTLWQGSPSLRLLWLRAGLAALGVLLLAIAAGWLGPRLDGVLQASLASAEKPWNGPSGTFLLSCAVGLYAVARAIGLGLQAARLRALHYRITNQRIVVERGMVSRAMEEIDLRLVDDLSFTQPALQRMLGIGSITVTSSDQRAPRLELVGLPQPRELRERLRAEVYQVSQRELFTRAT